MFNIFLDLETTGLNPLKGDKIIEICCMKVDNFFNKTFFHQYLNPGIVIKEEAFLIHHINNEFLKDKPYLNDEIIFNFINFIKNQKVIIHNAKFDLKFLNLELKKKGFLNLHKYCYKIIDSLNLSNKIYKNKKNSLDSLCKRFNLKYNRIKHSAILDVQILYEVYLNLFEITNLIKIKKKTKFKKKTVFSNNSSILKNASLKELSLNNFIKKILKPVF